MSIHELIESGDEDKVGAALAKNPGCIYQRNKYKQSALHIAAKTGSLRIIDLILEQSLKNTAQHLVIPYLNLLDSCDHDVVYYALNYGHIECFKRLVHFKKNIHIAAIDNTDSLGQTILNDVIVSLVLKKEERKFNPYEIAEYLLQLGANPLHDDRSPIGSYLNYLRKFKCPLEYWHLFLSYGAGICYDFARLRYNKQNPADIEFLTKATEGQLILGIWRGERITQETPGFSSAITNENELREWLDKKKPLRLKYLLAVINQVLIAANITSKSVLSAIELKNIAEVLIEYSFPSLKKIVSRQIKFFQDNSKFTAEQINALLRLPPELQDYLRNSARVDIPQLPQISVGASKKQI